MPNERFKTSRARGASRELSETARFHRRDMTPAEKVLWGSLRNRQLEGYKFRAQHPLGRFIIDFYCPSCRLVVEVDGGVHNTQKEKDAARTEELSLHGLTVLRFNNEDVLNNLMSVLQKIVETCKECSNKARYEDR